MIIDLHHAYVQDFKKLNVDRYIQLYETAYGRIKNKLFYGDARKEVADETSRGMDLRLN